MLHCYVLLSRAEKTHEITNIIVAYFLPPIFQIFFFYFSCGLNFTNVNFKNISCGLIFGVGKFCKISCEIYFAEKVQIREIYKV